jgi:predicted RNA-binding Zn ribbon-like protein
VKINSEVTIGGDLRANAKVNENGNLDFVGDHVAINFINTRRMHEGVLTDTLQSDESVIAWMRKMNVRLPLLLKPLRPKALLRTARNLRTLALRALERRKVGKRVRLGELNACLAEATSQLQLRKRRDGLDLERVYLAGSAEQYLAPVAEAIADLVAHGDFDLVRHCEGEKCVLWFYDRTKAHRRRWCTAGGCGTRARVAAFRARHAAESK